MKKRRLQYINYMFYFVGEREMGFFDKLVSVLGLRKKECNVLVVGLDNSGKSTVLNHFKPEEHRTSDIVPTVGFNVEKFKSRFHVFFKKNTMHLFVSAQCTPFFVCKN